VALGVGNLWHRHATSFAHAAAPVQSSPRSHAIRRTNTLEW
jgi:hypothetical protein